jgi:glycerate 2-kinase
MTLLIGFKGHNVSVIDLRDIYRRTLKRCAPERLIRGCVTPDMPRNVVAIGKCAAPLLEGAAQVIDIGRAFVAIPDGYREPRLDAEVAKGGHPRMTGASFDAGRRLLRFVEECDDILFLISGGGSACVESPLAPWLDEEDVAAANDRLIAAGIPIGEMNIVRKHLSAIKGGRLAARKNCAGGAGGTMSSGIHAPPFPRIPGTTLGMTDGPARSSGRSVTLVYSDVSTGALADVASGPTLPDPSTKSDAIAILERIGGCDRIVAQLREDSFPESVKHVDDVQVKLIADNNTLTSAAADVAREAGLTVRRWNGQIETDVAAATAALAAEAERLQDGELLVAGGEPTVVVRGEGKGGRCSELAVRVALAMATLEETPREQGRQFSALFGSSDGVDGNSGMAGIYLPRLPVALDAAEAGRELAQSSSTAIAARIGEAIMIPATGNNLRDLFLLARG